MTSQRSMVSAVPVGAVFAIWTLLLLSSPSAAFEIPSFLKASTGMHANQPVGTTAYQANQPYEGLEIPIYGRFVFRPALFKLEGGVVAVAFLFVLMHLVGKARNRQMAERWATFATPKLEQEFAAVSRDDDSKKSAVLWNGGNTAMMYASGRRGCAALHVTFDFQPRHDPLEMAYLFLYDIVTAATVSSLRDTITLTFTLPPTGDNISGIFALVNKNVLQATRSGRFDLSFTKVNDADSTVTSRGLSDKWAVMSESTDLTDAFLGDADQKGTEQRQRVGLVEALNGDTGKCLESLVLTDQPFERPSRGPIPAEKRERLLILTLRVPKSTAEAQKSAELIEVGANIVDAIDRGIVKVRQETLAKLRKTRAQVDKELLDEATKDQREAEKEAKEEAKRKADKAKFDKLSPAEQAKRKELERKRAMKKGAQRVRAG
ncbi:DUF1682-domain-containing protein [Testicularia cyperi]|uniref:DUF1682-domain-containing protein n=1 Tax=Testicularia cyperi TaxID=1882483 RepID=A0A317XKX9_9BASI|nr:DUF1682-domain-containing protein [Testicularia cyperi]